MKYKVVEHSAKASKQVMETMLTELENDGWYLKQLVYAGGSKVISLHTDVAPRSRQHGALV